MYRSSEIMLVESYIKTSIYENDYHLCSIQSVPGGMCQTSGECSLS